MLTDKEEFNFLHEMDNKTALVENFDWITNELLHDIISTNSTDVKILTVKQKPLPKSYTCKLFKIFITYSTNRDEDVHNTSFIAKIKDDKVTFAADFGMIGKEILMYKKGLPKLESILHEALHPHSLYLQLKDIIIMEDLNYRGYKHAADLLDYDHCVCSVKTLAKFHAASVTLWQEDSNLVQNLGEELFYREQFYEKFHSVAEDALQALADRVGTWPESKHYQQPILQIKNKIWKLLTYICTQNHKFRVLNHGDFSLNNILFKYSPSEKICDVKIIDFQCCRFCSPVFDLHFFLTSSVNISVVENHLYDILKIYLDTFKNTLSKLNSTYDISMADFELEFNKSNFMGLYAISISLPHVLSENDSCLKSINFEDFKNMAKNPVFKLMDSQRFRDMVPRILDDLNRRGLFKEEN